MRINQNTMANNAYRNLSTTNMSLGKSLEKLSSGFRINRAADDAAGLVISQNLRAQTSGLRQATRNAQDGISVVQTAEGALNEVHTILNRMRDLGVQSANSGANDQGAQDAAQAEISALSLEVTRISTSTQFGGIKLLSGTYGVSAATTLGAVNTGAVAGTAVTNGFDIAIAGGSTISVGSVDLTGTNAAAKAASLQTAVNSALTTAGSVHAGNASVTADATTGLLKLEIKGLKDTQNFTTSAFGATTAASTGWTAGLGTAASGTGGQFQIGANSTDTLNVKITGVDLTTLGITTLSVNSGSTNSAAAITAIDGAITKVSKQRGDLGAFQNRFESMINNLSVTTENLVASESRIRDTDMAAEMTNFTKNQILSQAGTAMLAQANQVPQSILSLLR